MYSECIAIVCTVDGDFVTFVIGNRRCVLSDGDIGARLQTVEG